MAGLPALFRQRAGSGPILPFGFFKSAQSPSMSTLATSALKAARVPAVFRFLTTVSTDRPLLVSSDRVDRVPWVSMKHPDFQAKDDVEPVGDIRGLTAVNPSFLLSFTCNVCEQQAVKNISKHAYQHGVVVVKCDKCGKLHLISDQLGWFSETTELTNIEEILKIKQKELKTDSEIDVDALQRKFDVDIQ